MASYIGDIGEVDAVQVTDSRQFGEHHAPKGSWLVTEPAGRKQIYAEQYFADNFRQKYPRLVADPDAPPPTMDDAPRAA